ncbi:rna polymerase ii-associated protein [Malassezia pachydermatis]|uniref:Rna polymerase ii-associated protein n=1 Tax=Malassezia pachydermatis TaxID=77020 RepID=A0A0M8MZC3_9BASI|nr:rna polymerase ii-associated protein [Malassezia pachydermatis]KOS16571.1 rna polymerase ii-associated protein [Malassezia pachydermatis]
MASTSSAPLKSLELVLATNESITIELDPLPPPEELEVVMEMLAEEKPPAHFWTALASRCWNEGRRAEAELIVARGCSILPVHRPEESIAVFALQAAFALADARTAPKQVMEEARYQPLHEKQAKQHYFRQASEALGRAQSLNPQHPMMIQARAVFALNTGDNALASRLFDVLLSRTPTHPVALLGRACTQLRARHYTAALQTYQQVLRQVLRRHQLAEKHNDPSLRWRGPDPRIGMGLCLWGLGRHEAARRAWQRAAAWDEQASAPRLLLGLSLLDVAKEASPLPTGWYGAHTQRPEDEARRAAYADGIVHLQAAWQRDKTCAMAAVALASHIASQAAHALAPAMPAAHDMTTPMTPLTPEKADHIEPILQRALKLSEHAVQYADARSVVVHAWLQYAYALQLASHMPKHSADHALRQTSQRYYGQALEILARTTQGEEHMVHPLAHGHALAALGLAQWQATTGDTQGAVKTLESVLSRPAGSAAYVSELALMAGLLLATPAPGAPPAEAAADRRRARHWLDRTMRVAVEAHTLLTQPGAVEGSTLEAEKLAPLAWQALARLGEDARVRALLAQLWAKSAHGRAIEQYEAALQTQPQGALQYALELNIGALLAHESDTHALHKALTHLQAALQAPDDQDEASVAVKVLANYNMGRTFEALGQTEQAREAYHALLAAHPEYVDARVRLAIMAAQTPQHVDVTEHGVTRSARDTANAKFKEALSSDPGDLSVRAEYMRFLAGAYPANRQAAWGALKDTAAQLFLGAEAGKSVFGSASVARRVADEARQDAYILGTLGWAYYQLGLHTPAGPQQRAERTKSMVRAADLFDKALAAHHQNVFAAQGLAILLADDALGDPTAAPDVIETRRKQAAEDAAALFGKLRDVRDDASVYVCQGHAFMICGALERAAHVYELALTRFGHARDPTVLQYSARALYALGLRDKQFAQLQQAMAQLSEAQDVLEARAQTAGPQSSAAAEAKQVAYNRAVMAQKALQMLYDLPVKQRVSEELAEAIGWVEAAQRILPGLREAAQQGQLLYITADVVEQRAKYADMSLLRQASQHLDEVRAYETEQREHLARLDEKQKEKEAHLAQLRREKEEEHRRRAEALAESRRRAREEASQIEYLREPSPEPRKRSAGGGGGGGSRKKKAAPAEDDFVARDDEALFEESSDEDDDQEAPVPMDEEADEEGETQPAAGPEDDMGASSGDEASSAPAPNSMRARLEALARERKQRQANQNGSEESSSSTKKRHGDKASRRASKKAKVVEE